MFGSNESSSASSSAFSSSSSTSSIGMADIENIGMMRNNGTAWFMIKKVYEMKNYTDSAPVTNVSRLVICREITLVNHRRHHHRGPFRNRELTKTLRSTASSISPTSWVPRVLQSSFWWLIEIFQFLIVVFPRAETLILLILHRSYATLLPALKCNIYADY